jgi:hypothetical protein
MTRIQSYLISVAEKGGFNIIFDATGNTLNGVSAVLTDRAIPDLTDDVIKEGQR